MKLSTCRFCNGELTSFCDLGLSPLANSYLSQSQLQDNEAFYPLHAYICKSCFLVQLEEFENPENIFHDYAYFSSYSVTWLKHCQNYTDLIVDRFHLGSDSQVVEVASNDGCLLKCFQGKGIPILGIEPAKNIAQIAETSGVPTLAEFFNSQIAKKLAAEGKQADLLMGNNVLAHVPSLNDFVRGLKILLKPGGVITMEFPSLLRLIEENQFDTIYHEHFSHFSWLTAEKIFTHHGLCLFDVDELETHGGSLRIYACHNGDSNKKVSNKVLLMKRQEIGLSKLSAYQNFSEQVKETKKNLISLLSELKKSGKSISGYGAPAKGNTLLNYCGIGANFIDYTVDLNPHKQGRFLPGTHIPIYHPDKIRETRPDYLLILPWNLKNEIISQMEFISEWGGKFITPIPKAEVQS